MRLKQHYFLATLLLTTLAFPALSFCGQDPGDSPAERGGTAPRPSAERYHAHAQRAGVNVGAELLTPKEVSKRFAAELNRCCLVVEVAVYPKTGEPLQVSPADFTLVVETTDTPARPESAPVVAAKLQKVSPSSGITTSEQAGVGYESGTYSDPVTGQPVHVHGVTTFAGGGVAVGNNGSASVEQRNREIIERELSEKSLPEAKIAVPVSGCLYFNLPKQKKNTKYRLEYVLNNETVILQLP